MAYKNPGALADEISKTPLDKYGEPIDINNLDLYDESDIYELDEYGSVALPKKIRRDILEHPLYGLTQREQDPAFLKDVIHELSRNTQSPEHMRAFGAEGSIDDAKKQLARYRKALDYLGGK